MCIHRSEIRLQKLPLWFCLSSVFCRANQDHQEVAWVHFGKETDGYRLRGSPEAHFPCGSVALHRPCLLWLHITLTTKRHLKLFQNTYISFTVTKASYGSWQNMFCSQLFVIRYAALVYSLLSSMTSYRRNSVSLPKS